MDKHTVLIAHGAWFEPEGVDKKGNETIFEIPENLKIRIYGLQNTPMLVTTGKSLLTHIINNNGECGFNHGQNLFNGVEIYYKEFAKGTSSSMISNYAIGGADKLYFVGLHFLPKKREDPDVHFDSAYHSNLKNIIEKHNISGVLHLLCCQNFK